MKQTSLFCFIILCLFNAGAASLITTEEIEKGSTCPNGGILISIIDDENNNGIVDEGETASDTQILCNGEDGSNGNGTAVKTEEVDQASCPNGKAIKISTGPDANNDGEIDGSTYYNIVYLCAGKDGTDGAAGADGADGADGENGLNALVKTSSDSDGVCENGGIKIEVGLDENNNGVLDAVEVDDEQTQYVCNGADGADGEKGETGEKGDKGASGTNGTNGEKGDQGAKGDTGDKGATGMPGETGEKGDAGEDGKDGQNGMTTLVSVSDEAAGENCAAGGKKIEYGLDANSNNKLDPEEILPESAYYVCNGNNAEEAGLVSSSTGCSTTAVESCPLTLTALLASVFAFFTLLFVKKSENSGK